MAATDPQPANAKGLLAELKRDPKRAVVLAVLGAVLLVIGGRLLLQQLGSPRTGAAAQGPAGRAQDDPAHGKAPGDVWAKASQGAAQPKAPAARSLPLVRDIFTPNPTFFPPHRPAPAAATAKVVDDPEARLAAERRAALAQASSLVLQTTVVGATGTAIINGQVLRVGDTIGGFRVVEIASRSCTLAKGAVRVTLEMTN